MTAGNGRQDAGRRSLSASKCRPDDLANCLGERLSLVDGSATNPIRKRANDLDHRERVALPDEAKPAP